MKKEEKKNPLTTLSPPCPHLNNSCQHDWSNNDHPKVISLEYMQTIVSMADAPSPLDETTCILEKCTLDFPII
jgi:hypothetical protein